MATSRRVLLWFRNDLRVRDHAALARAAERVKRGEADEVVACYCLDPRHFAKTPFGSLKTHFHRSRFLLESVRDLKTQLRAIGSDLLVRVGRPEEVLPTLEGQWVVAHAEATWEETQVEKKVEKAMKRLGGGLELVWGYSLYHLDDLPYPKGNLQMLPDVFTPFRNQVEGKCKPRQPLPPPSISLVAPPKSYPEGMDFWPDLDSLPLTEEVRGEMKQLQEQEEALRKDQTMPRWEGGETTAAQRLHHYLWETDAVARYFETRNGLLGGDYSTKFSPWLAHGCITPRQIWSELQRYETQRVKNKSTYWVVFELTWRDYFRFFCMKYGSQIFFEGGAKDMDVPWRRDHNLIQRWKDGMTGMPLVDANMRELKATGFMSNRGRQNVASYFCLDMGMDWRYGADHFESLLLDHDVTANYGNWNSAAGLTGGRINKFNIVKQSNDYDPEGKYIRCWVPELREVPVKYLFEPWKMPLELQERCGCVVGRDYPSPIPTKTLGRPDLPSKPSRGKPPVAGGRKPPRVQNTLERVWRNAGPGGRPHP